MISVLILTHNEEQNIAACLHSVRWSDDIVVFDSFSTDRTVEIAKGLGARVVQRAFTDYGSQREAARTLVKYQHPWVFALDADEMPDQELVNEMIAIANMPASDYSAFRMRRKDHFMGRWIRHATLYPSWFIRFYRPDRVAYDVRAVHEYPIVQGAVGELAGHILHDNFSKGLKDWVCKHARYAQLEAGEDIRSLEKASIDWLGIISLNPVIRRKALKQLSFRLPFRPMLRFWYMYLIRLGWLDGVPGYHYCRLLAFYEYLIVLNMRETRLQANGRTLSNLTVSSEGENEHGA